MNKKSKQQIILEEILILLEKNKKGLKYSELRKKVASKHDISLNTIGSCIVNLEKLSDNEAYKVEKGFFRLSKYKEKYEEKFEQEIEETIKEQVFYQPFADYLINELEECTRAIELGGSKFKDKWGTPDVIGVLEPKRSDPIKFLTEVVSAEIKIDTNSLITAFGQACAYKLFSHRSYIVVPKHSSPEDLSRIDSLCRLFGIGLILFNSKNKDNPNFEIRVRSIKNIPDMFYTNKYMKLLEDKLF